MSNVSVSIALAALLGVPAFAASQTYPTKPVRLIVPLAAGTGTDQVSRVLAQKMSEQLGQQVVVENRPGAGATIGTEAAARAPGDGHTLYIGGSVSLTISPALFGKVRYDPLRDFAAVALVSRFYLALSVHPSLPVRSVAELVALARARPGDLVIGSGGSGTTSHLTGALFEHMARIKLLHVPYKGGGDSLVAIMSGQAQLAYTPVSLAQQQSRYGKLRTLGVTSAQRLASWPEIAAIAETITGFEWSGWQVLMVPAATPQDIVKRLNAAAQSAMAAPDFQTHLEREGSEPFHTPAEQFPDFLKAEMAKNAQLVRISGARAE